MALIKCPECNKEISDKSPQCIHCGYPISETITQNRTDERICIVNGKSIYLDFLLDNIEIKEKMSKLVGTIDCNSIMAYKIIQEVENTHQIPQTLNFETRTQSLERQAQEKIQKQSNIPHCPTCGSTDIQKISGTKRWFSTGLFGLASSDIGKSMCCKKCGYKW